MVGEPETPAHASLRYFGLCGILASTFTLAADWILLGALTSGQEFNASWLERLAAMPRWRLAVGGAAGPIGACLYAIGFWHVYLALRPAGRGLAFTCYAGFTACFICLAGSFHAAFPFIGWLVTIREAVQGNAVIDASYADAGSYFRILFYLGAAPGLVAVVVLPYLLLRKQTRYPSWFVLVNPALLWCLSAAFRFVPAPLGGLLVIGSGNLVFLVFFIISTCVLWNEGAPRADSAESAD